MTIQLSCMRMVPRRYSVDTMYVVMYVVQLYSCNVPIVTIFDFCYWGADA